MSGQVKCWCWQSPQKGNVGMAPAVPWVSFPVVTRGFQGRVRHSRSLSAFAGLLGCMGTLHAAYTGNTPVNDPGVSINHAVKREPFYTAAGDASWCNHHGKQCRGSTCTLCRFSRIQLCDPTDPADLAPLSMGLSRQGCWSGLLCSPSWPRDQTCISYDSQLASGFFNTEPPGKSPERLLERLKTKKHML